MWFDQNPRVVSLPDLSIRQREAKGTHESYETKVFRSQISRVIEEDVQVLGTRDEVYLFRAKLDSSRYIAKLSSIA